MFEISVTLDCRIQRGFLGKTMMLILQVLLLCVFCYDGANSTELLLIEYSFICTTVFAELVK